MEGFTLTGGGGGGGSGVWGAITGTLSDQADLSAALVTKAPANATYLTATAEAGLSNEVTLGALTTGYLKIAVAGAVATPSTTATVPTTDLSGTLAAAQFPALTGDVTTVAGALVTTIGAGKVTDTMIVSLAATKLTGTIADARLSANVPLLDAANVFTNLTGNMVSGTSGAAAAVTFSVRNLRSDAGTSVWVGNDASPQMGSLSVYGTTHGLRANQVWVRAVSATGVLILAANDTEAVRIHASRGVSLGDTTDPGATNLRVAGTVTVIGALTAASFPAASLTGTLADARLSTNVPLLDSVNTFTTGPTSFVADSSGNVLKLRGRASDNIGTVGFYDNTGATRYGILRGLSAAGGSFLFASETTGQVTVDTTIKIYPVLSLVGSGAAIVAGQLTLVAGTKTINTTAVSATCLIFFQRKTAGGTIGFATTYTQVNGTSFTLNSDSALDTSVYNWWIVETH